MAKKAPLDSQADVRRLRELLRQCAPHLVRVHGRVPYTLLNEVRVAVGMKALVVPGEKHAETVLAWMRGHPGEHDDFDVAKGAWVSQFSTTQALELLAERGEVEQVKPKALTHRRGWCAIWKLAPEKGRRTSD